MRVQVSELSLLYFARGEDVYIHNVYKIRHRRSCVYRIINGMTPQYKYSVFSAGFVCCYFWGNPEINFNWTRSKGSSSR